MEKSVEVLTDTTTFTLTQQIFDNPIGTSLMQLKNLEAMIQYLIFYEKIWILEPTVFGTDIHVNTPQLVDTFVGEKIVMKYSPEFYLDTEDFLKNQYNDLKILIEPKTIESFCASYIYDQCEFNDYERYYQFSSQNGVKKLACNLGIRDYSLIPPVANLIRSHIYLQAVQEMKKNTDKIITYSPYFTRASLVEELFEDIKINRLQMLLDHVLKDFESKERADRDYYRNKYGIRAELDLPILTSVVLNKCNSKNDIVDTILELRTGNDAKKIRNFFNKIHVAVDNGDLKSLREYDAQLCDILEELQLKSSKSAILNSMPGLSSEFLRSAVEAAGGLLAFVTTANPEGVSTVFGGISGGIKEVNKYFSNRDSVFLFNLKHSVNDVICSRDEFARVFGTEIK